MISTNKLLFLTIFIIFQLCSMDTSDHTISVFKAYLFDQQGVPTSEFTDVLGTLNVKHDGTSESIVKETQTLFCHAGKECHEIEKNEQIKEKTLLPCLERLGVWKEKRPRQATYEGIIVTDAHEIDWQVRRISFLHKMAIKNYKACALYMCASENPMRSFSSDHLAHLVQSWPKNQVEYEQLLVHSKSPYRVRECVKDLFASIQIPRHLGAIPRVEVVSSMHANGDRPTTMDNVQNFLNKNSEDGLYCIVSDQPHIPYQEMIFRLAALRNKRLLEFEGVGSEALTRAQGGLNTGQHLDRLARYIHTEYQYVQEYQKTLMQVSEKS